MTNAKKGTGKHTLPLPKNILALGEDELEAELLQLTQENARRRDLMRRLAECETKLRMLGEKAGSSSEPLGAARLENLEAYVQAKERRLAILERIAEELEQKKRLLESSAARSSKSTGRVSRQSRSERVDDATHYNTLNVTQPDVPSEGMLSSGELLFREDPVQVPNAHHVPWADSHESRFTLTKVTRGILWRHHQQGGQGMRIKPLLS